jgi:aspartate dehydrogenase
MIAHAVADGRLKVEIAALFDQDPSRSRDLANLLDNPSLSKTDFESFITTDLDLVVEAASPEAVVVYAERVVGAGRDLVVLSVGALLDRGLRERVVEAAEREGVRLFIPSGAIGGLDALKGASFAGFQSVILTTTKNPRSLPEGKGVKSRTVIYEGDAEDAVLKFPKNINVAAAIALATGTNPEVRIVADPDVERIQHKVEARGSFGRMTFTVENLPSPDNPKTSYLAALSVIKTIQSRNESISIGT